MEKTKNWDKYYAERRKKKQRNREFSTNLLKEKGIPFESFKNGDHLHVKFNGYNVDFWPSTGLFIDRDSDYKARGVNTLLKYLKTKKDLIPNGKKRT